MKKTDVPRLFISNPLTAADLRYLCGVELPETALVIQFGRRITLVVSEMEYNRLRRTVRPNVTVLYPELAGTTWKEGMASWIIKLLPSGPVEVSASFPFGLAGRLQSAGFQMTVSSVPVCPQREIKTSDELEAIRASQRAAVEALRQAVRRIAAARISSGGFLREGSKILTAEAVRATIGHVLLDHGCHAPETIVACGVSSADPHERGAGPLFAGQPVVMDIFPRSTVSGYWGDLTRTVCRGPAPDRLRQMFLAVRAAHSAALAVVRAGAWTDAVHAAAAMELEKHGFRTGAVGGCPQGFIHGTGHGVGLEIHEAPRISSAVHQKLRAGQVITIEPGLYYPELGGVRIEDTVAVTSEGYALLSRCAIRLQI